MSILGVTSKLLSESLTSLYPVFVKNIGLPLELQLWSRCFTYVAIALVFVNYRTLWKHLFSTLGVLLSLLTLIHIYTSYKGFLLLESGTAYALFYLYPLFIILLSGDSFHPIQLVAMAGVLFLTGQFNFVSGYGVVMMLIAALTEALIYFVVRKMPTSNWNHLFISYSWSAMFLTLYYWNHLQFNESTLSASIAINGVIGVVGYWLRFYSMGRLTPLVYALLSYIGIVMSFVYGWWFNQEQLTLNKIIGVICILIPNIYQQFHSTYRS
jgi:drug/metabolite transporter (DMT)-like permease